MATNVVVLEGSILGTPEIKSTSGGKTLANFQLQQENYKKDPFVFKITAWGDLAETVGGLPEGAKLTVYGRMTSREYEWQGKQKTSQDLVADSVNVRKDSSGNTAKPAAKTKTRPTYKQDVDESEIPF